MSLVAGIQLLESDQSLSNGIEPDLGIIGIIGTAGKGTVGQCVFHSSNKAEGDAFYGEDDNANGFTIPKARTVGFRRYPAATVSINVCNPSTHTTNITAESSQMGTNGIAKFAKNFVSAVVITNTFKVKKTFTVANTITMLSGITTITAVKTANGVTPYTITTDYTVAGNVITRVGLGAIPVGAEVEITYTNTLVLGTDYTVNAEGGSIQRVPTSTKLENNSIVVANYTYVDPTKVTVSDIAAGVAEFLNSQSRTGYKPRILLAPGSAGVKPGPSTIDSITTQLLNVADDLKAVVEINVQGATVSDFAQYRNDFDNERLRLSWGNHRVSNSVGAQEVQYFDVARAFERVKVDALRGLQYSISNRVIADATSIDRVIDYNNSATDTANLIAGIQGNTVINDGGIRFWRDFAATSNTARRSGNVRRILDFETEVCHAIAKQFLDEPLNQATIDRILFLLNNRLAQDKQLGIILGGEALFSDKNTPTTLANQELYIDYKLTVVKPTLLITLTQVLTDEYVKELL